MGLGKIQNHSTCLKKVMKNFIPATFAFRKKLIISGMLVNPHQILFWSQSYNANFGLITMKFGEPSKGC